MKSASIFIFCAPEEITVWTRLLCSEKHLGAIEFRDSEDFGGITLSAEDINFHEDTYRTFLFPVDRPPKTNLSMNDVRAREWGWIDIRPGCLSDEDGGPVLLISEFHGENFDFESVHPVRYVSWLKRKIAGESTAGVVGKNVSTNGQSLYHDIRYTERARILSQSGVAWKQFLNGVVIFEPL